jgi:hypothetical protein
MTWKISPDVAWVADSDGTLYAMPMSTLHPVILAGALADLWRDLSAADDPVAGAMRRHGLKRDAVAAQVDGALRQLRDGGLVVHG